MKLATMSHQSMYVPLHSPIVPNVIAAISKDFPTDRNNTATKNMPTNSIFPYLLCRSLSLPLSLLITFIIHYEYPHISYSHTHSLLLWSLPLPLAYYDYHLYI